MKQILFTSLENNLNSFYSTNLNIFNKTVYVNCQMLLNKNMYS